MVGTMETVEPPVTPNPNETPPPQATSQAVAAKPSLKERFKTLLADCAVLAIIVYFSIFFACLAGFAVLLHLGFDVKGAGGNAGVLAGAWAATKLTQPIRIMATLALTPPLERALRRAPGLHARLTALNKRFVELMRS
jgi:hypothetical protein